MGASSQITVKGTVTVRVGVNVPANAMDLARRAADTPEIEHTGDVVRLRPPADADTRRAATVSYEIKVPAGTPVVVVTDSGEVTLDGAVGALSVKSSSAAISLAHLGGKAEISTGSGSVSVSGATSHVNVSSQSGGLELRELRAGLHARTQSGNLSATFAGPGDVDVETGSSAITLQGVHGGLTLSTQSGRVTASGTPARPWTITTSSSAIKVSVAGDAPLTLDAKTRSGSIDVEGMEVRGTNEKRHVAGAVGGGGPLVRLTSGSGSIQLVRGAR